MPLAHRRCASAKRDARAFTPCRSPAGMLEWPMPHCGARVCRRAAAIQPEKVTIMLKTLTPVLALCAALAFAVPLQATAASADCEKKAVDKNGKPLAGAAKTSFMKKCEGESGGAASCEAKAVDKNGKPLAGAAKTSFIKKCEADGGKK